MISVAELRQIATAEPERRPRGVVDGLLVAPRRMVEEAQAADPTTQAATVRVLLLAILGGMAAFGVAVGFYRGGVQMLYAAIKLPLVVLLTAAVAMPALTALGA